MFTRRLSIPVSELVRLFEMIVYVDYNQCPSPHRFGQPSFILFCIRTTTR